MVTFFARVTGSRKVGRLRPARFFAGLRALAVDDFGIDEDNFLRRIFAAGSTSITAIRLLSPICGAARPTPLAAYMDSNTLSSINFDSGSGVS